MDYAKLKKEVLRPKNIQRVKGYYRYVSHPMGLATTGFKMKVKLLEYTNDLRFDERTIAKMRERYAEIFSVSYLTQ